MTKLARFLGALRALTGRRLTLADRLEMFPTRGLPMRDEVEIRWNDYQVPFIIAREDYDLGFSLGLVHAHLREAQLSLLRLAAQGRLSEVAGPFTLRLDRVIRRLDFARAVPQIEAELPADTREWLQAFVDGLNHYRERVPQRPVEMDLLGIPREPFTLTELLRIGRFAGADLNLLAYHALLPRRLKPGWTSTWERILDIGLGSVPSFSPEAADMDLLRKLLLGSGRNGSNSVVVSAEKSASGAGLIASDPHLGIELPNFWLIAGGKSPSHHFVGLMPPGFPVCALGRTPHLAWGGTHMRAASSQLYDVASLPPDQIRESRESIRVRGWRSQTVVRRDTPVGPILDEPKFLPGRPGERLALQWVGYEASDELTAFLRGSRARTLEEFREAFQSYAVSSQNILAVDQAGNTAMIMGARLPVRDARRPGDLVLDPADPRNLWTGTIDPASLPWKRNPAEGFIASANNKPVDLPFPIGYFWEQPDRIDRLQSLLGGSGQVDENFLRRLQFDVHSRSAHRLSRELVQLFRECGMPPEGNDLLAAVAGWDGCYHADGRNPLAFELLLHHAIVATRHPRAARSPLSLEWDQLSHHLVDDLKNSERPRLQRALRKALRRAERAWRRHGTWGSLHRLRLRHPLARIPLLGRFAPQVDLPASGSRETLMKAAHDFGDRRLDTFHGAQARHLSSMDDLDNNRFVILGGQDGWIGSENQLDQVDLWQRGEYLQVPLRVESVRRDFKHCTRLRAGAASPE